MFTRRQIQAANTAELLELWRLVNEEMERRRQKLAQLLLPDPRREDLSCRAS